MCIRDRFWREANGLAAEPKMDRVLSYMYLMLSRARAARKSVRRESFVALGRDLEFYPGVDSWFDRIKEFGETLGVEIEHYIISSGLREIIEGSSSSAAVKEIYASEFYYDETGRPV